MQMQRLNIQLPRHLKARLDALRKQGTTASGLIRITCAEGGVGSENASDCRRVTI